MEGKCWLAAPVNRRKGKGLVIQPPRLREARLYTPFERLSYATIPLKGFRALADFCLICFHDPR